MAKPVFVIMHLTEDQPVPVKVVKFEIPGGVTDPSEFAEAVGEIIDRLPGQEPVLLNGRGPVWGYGMLIHAAHPTPAVGCFDPRLGGYVVVATHSDNYGIGDIIPDPEA